ncbi:MULTISPECIES: hypothetical protein [unclassified Flavobacterium]|uniref:hypothetical protein n=1 Tax=unclassified Flavobacterium TaxID=196869 RepID=UPI001F12DC47|nr:MULTISPECIES: hypothetical protein [unclassified Flavobacterium]UMY66148.1 hypothetical protein MKO97_01855 [Flavobacterium sp. HJ-32-4]
MRTLVSILSLLFILVGKTSYAGVSTSFDRSLTTVTVEKEKGPAWHADTERPVSLDEADLDVSEETAFDHDYDGSDAAFASLYLLRDDWLRQYVAPSLGLFTPSPVVDTRIVIPSLPIYLQNRVLRI